MYLEKNIDRTDKPFIAQKALELMMLSVLKHITTCLSVWY